MRRPHCIAMFSSAERLWVVQYPDHDCASGDFDIAIPI
jgi:hypothetical protein